MFSSALAHNKIGTQTFGPLIKVSNQNKVIRRQIPPAPTVMESVIAVFVIIVSLIASDAGVRLGRPL